MTEENQVKLTKSKSEGRVAAGKKLAEWNKQNKAKLKQVTSQELAQEVETSQNQVKSSENSSNLQVLESSGTSHSSGVKSSHILMFLAGIGTFFGLAYILKNRATTKAAESKAETSKPKIFDPWR